MTAEPPPIQLVVGVEADGTRLDQFIADAVDELSRARIQRLVDEGQVTVNGVLGKASRKVRAGAVVEVVVPPPDPVAAEPEDIPLTVLFEDEHLIVIDKPAGMVVHPAAGHPSGTLVNALLFHCKDLSGIGGALRPGIVHRIDKDTSGVMVATKTDSTHHAMADMFKDKVPQREYMAVVSPAPKQDQGTIESLYGRHRVHRKRFSSKVREGKHAVTHWQVEERMGNAAVVRCRLDTGRTHQIRVHMADSGWPLIGDPVYGRRYGGELAAAAKTLGRQALHAQVLAFAHPQTGEPLSFTSPIPADIRTVITALKS